MKLIRKQGHTSSILQIFVRDSSSTTGAGLTGLVFNTPSLTAYYHRNTDTTATAISLVTMTVGTFTSSGFKEIDATNMPGWYQFCPPDAAFASGATSVVLHLKGAANMAPLPIEIDLDAQVDVTSWNGTAVASPATAGIPDINVKNINNVSAASVTTINANVGTTQPVNFTGTGGSALAKSDAVDWAGGAIPAPNVTGVPKVDVIDWLGTAPLALSSQQVQAVVPSATVVASVTGAVGSVTGAVGSVIGNVGGNLVGSVGSLTATAVQDIWDALTSVLTTAGSIGKLLAALPGSIWDVVISGHTNAGTTGAALNTASSAGDPWATALPGSYSAGQAGKIIGDNIDATISSRTKPADTQAAVTTAVNLTNAPTNGDFTAAMKASLDASTPAAIMGPVASVVADVGITQAGADKVFGASGAAMTELSGVPSASPSPHSALMLIFQALRNKLTVTSSSKGVYNDAGTQIASKALADDGTTFTESKMV